MVNLVWVTDWYMKKATVIPQFLQTLLEDEYNAMQPTYVNALPGTTSMVTPIVKSTPVTQASEMPLLPIVPSSERDILEPLSNEQARSALFGETDARYE